MNKKKKMMLAGIGAAAGAMALIMLAVWLIFGRTSLEGMWRYDKATRYVFKDGGKGALVLPDAEYAFSYTLNEDKDKVSIDFEYEKARDMTYSYKCSWGTLTLTEENGKSYELKKE